MNNTFDLSRFSKLFKKHTRENLSFYLMSVLVLAGILTAFLSYAAYVTKGDLFHKGKLQFQIYLIVFLLSGSIFSSTVFSHLGSMRSRATSLMLPSSGLEKYMVGWVYTFVLFPILYTGIFYAVDGVIALSVAGKKSHQIEIWNVFSAKRDEYMAFVLFYLLASIGFWGAIVFRKQHFIKTAALFFVLSFVLVLANTAFIKHLIVEPLSICMPFGDITFKMENSYHRLNLSTDVTYIIATVAVLVPILWLSAYFKFKEKEV